MILLFLLFNKVIFPVRVWNVDKWRKFLQQTSRQWNVITKSAIGEKTIDYKIN
jgi:hypothetical protein